jgi:hypothetical protein
MTTGLTFKQRLTFRVLDTLLGLANSLSMRANYWGQKLSWYRMRHLLLKPRPGDIYVATAPKTGTTWTMQIVYQLLTGGRGEFEHIYQVAPFLDQLHLKPFGERVLEELPSPRIFKTHLYYEQLAPPPDSRVIYVTRNAADAIVSLHHHHSMREGFKGKLGRPFIQGHPLSYQWFRHLESWWPHRNDANVLHLRYEDLAADLEGGIRKVARFLGIAIDEERMPDILEKCGFAYMKKHTERFDVRLGLFQGGTEKLGFIRKGVVGDSRTAMTPEAQAAVNELMLPLRKKLGISETEL